MIIRKSVVLWNPTSWGRSEGGSSREGEIYGSVAIVAWFWTQNPRMLGASGVSGSGSRDHWLVLRKSELAEYSKEWRHKCFRLGGSVPLRIEERVVKFSSSIIWNWGLTCPVDEFIMKETFPAWNGDLPTCIPNWMRESYLGIFLPDCKEPSKKKAGQSKACLFLMLKRASEDEKWLHGCLQSLSKLFRFTMRVTSSRERGHHSSETISGQ